MRQYTQRAFIKIVEKNGFHYNRCNGSHAIYVNDKGNHISVPLRIASVIARRLIRENNLQIFDKRIKKNLSLHLYN